MSDDIYSYIKENFGLEITDYQFKRDYIKEPLKRSNNNKLLEYPLKEDLLYLFQNLSCNQISLITKINAKSLRKIRKKYNIELDYNLISKIRNNTYLKFHSISMHENFRKKSKKTFLKKYGVDNPFKNKIIQEKQKNTCLKKYGVKYFLQSNNYKELYKNSAWNDKIQYKKSLSKRKNNSFNKSKEEDKIYELLIQKYPNVLRQYKSKLYPFNCDFYITELDLYIEYQGFWMHGFEPYIGTDKQIEKVNLWETNNKRQYKRAIQTWTIRDPLKRQTAKDNKLNYLEFFNMKEFMEWYNQIK